MQAGDDPCSLDRDVSKADSDAEDSDLLNLHYNLKYEQHWGSTSVALMRSSGSLLCSAGAVQLGTSPSRCSQ